MLKEGTDYNSLLKVESLWQLTLSLTSSFAALLQLVSLYIVSVATLTVILRT